MLLPLLQVSLDGGRDYRLVLQRAYDRGEARKGDRFRRGRCGGAGAPQPTDLWASWLAACHNDLRAGPRWLR